MQDKVVPAKSMFHYICAHLIVFSVVCSEVYGGPVHFSLVIHGAAKMCCILAYTGDSARF